MKAHKELEDLVFVREMAHFKPVIEQQLCQMIYDGLWFNPTMDALIAFLKQSQEVVNGVLRVKLFKGNVIVEGRKSDNSLYICRYVRPRSSNRLHKTMGLANQGKR